MLVWGDPGVPLPTGGHGVGKGPPDTLRPEADPAWGHAAGRLEGEYREGEARAAAPGLLFSLRGFKQLQK